MKSLILTLLLTAAAPSFAQDHPPAIQILMDDSGVLLEGYDAQHYKLLLLGQLKTLASRRATSIVQIDVISTSLGRTIWSGTPMTLRRDLARAQELVDAIRADGERCNNLPGAFAELRSNLMQLERSGASEVHVLIFSSLIDTPRPCSATTRIELPQLPPVEGNINGTLTSTAIVNDISFYWVSPHQKRVWEEFLSPAFLHAKIMGITINLFDVERSKRELHSTPLRIGENP